jgi:aryl-alcohol dehydrogenase-like predicted oxidoreductase
MYKITHKFTRRQTLQLMLASAAAGMASPGSLLAARNMLERPIPSSGEGLPVIGLGTSRVFDHAPGDETYAGLADVLKTLYEGGGTLVDTSPMYGRSETTLGELSPVAGVGDKLFWATKVWTEGKEAGIRQMETSMQRMGVKQMDLIQVHNLVDWKTQMDTLDAWKEEGRIRYTGITHYQASAFNSLAKVMKARKPDFVQLNYSLLDLAAEQEMLPLSQELGTAVLVNRPFQNGRAFQVTRGKPLPGIAEELQCTSWAQLFLKYVVSHPAVTCVIPGTSKVRHMQDNVLAGTGPMPDENQRQRLRALAAELG